MAGRFSVEAVFKAVDRITAPINRMQRRVGRFTKSMERSLRRVDRVTGKINKGLGKVGKVAKRAFLGLVGGGSTALVMLNRASVRSTQLAESVGGSARSMEALTGAIKGAGFEGDHLVDLMEEMNNKIGESRGLHEVTTPVAESLRVLNLRFQDLQKMSPEEQFTRIMDAAMGMEDAQKAAAAADILMGGEASKMIGVLRRQGGTMSELIERYERLNARTKAGRQGSAAFVEALNDAQFIVTSLAQEIAGLIGGSLSPLIDRFTDFLAKNKELIASRAVEWFQLVRDNFGKIVQWLERIGVALLVWFSFVAILKTFITVMTAVNLVMAMNPIGLIVLGVMAAIAAISALVFWFEDIKAWFLDLPTWGRVAFMALLGPIGVLIGAASLLMDNWGPVKAFFVDTFTTVRQFFDDMVRHMTDKIEWIMGLVEKASRGIGMVGRWLGFGDDDEDSESRRNSSAAGGAQMISPQERIARTFSERTETQRNEVVIRDETGRAEQTGPNRAGVLRLEPSGAF